MLTKQNIGKLIFLTFFTINSAIANSDLNRPCFAWRPCGKSGLFKTELVIDT